MIAVAVSAHNRCYYCLVAHGAAVRQLSGDPALGELMAMNYRAARLSQRERAMLDFAVKLTRRAVAASKRRIGKRCAAPASPTAISGTSPPSPVFSTCPTAWRPPPTCGRTASIMARRDDALQTAMTKPTQLPIISFSNLWLRRLTMRAVIATVAAGIAVGVFISRRRRPRPRPARRHRQSFRRATSRRRSSTVSRSPPQHPRNLKFKMTFTADGKMKRHADRHRQPGRGDLEALEGWFLHRLEGRPGHCFTVVSAGDKKWSVLKGSTVMATWSK